MTKTLKQEIAAAGWTHVKTAAGWVPIADWTPYGVEPESLRDEAGSLFRVDGDTVRERERFLGPRPEGFALGRWPLKKMDASASTPALSRGATRHGT